MPLKGQNGTNFGKQNRQLACCLTLHIQHCHDFALLQSSTSGDQVALVLGYVIIKTVLNTGRSEGDKQRLLWEAGAG
jgi:hypothetical protein